MASSQAMTDGRLRAVLAEALWAVLGAVAFCVLVAVILYHVYAR